MEIKYTKSDRFPQLCYRKEGNGPAIVLIHGFPQNSELWALVCSQLADSFTVIAPDLPGVGGSTGIGTDLTVEQMAQSIQCILENEHIETVILAGHSMGGYTALAFADMYPAMVKGVAMVHSLTTADSEEKKENRRKAISLIQKGGKEAFIRQMIPTLFSKAYKQEHPDILELQIKQGSQAEDDSLIAFYNAMINRPDRGKTLSRAGFPVQWVIGREDTIASAGKVMQQTRLASVNFVSVYDDCAHMSMLEQPVELIKDLTYFSTYCYKN